MSGLDLPYLRRASPIANPRWLGMTYRACQLMFGRFGTAELVVEGQEHLPDEPAIFAPNHTHSLDALPLRYFLLSERREHLMTWVKGRVFNDPRTEWFFRVTGCVPITSRGYILSADFQRQYGRRPELEEYRALRAYIDGDEPDLHDPRLSRMREGPRDLLGTTFDPSHDDYRSAVQRAYGAMMQETLRLARVGRDAGRHQHLYPQGATSTRLTDGRIGCVQAAWALDVPVVPVGISGARRAFQAEARRANEATSTGGGADEVPSPRRGGSPATRWPRGRIIVRFGRPIRVPRTLLPSAFEPFSPADERAHRAVLAGWTRGLMEAIDVLLEPEHRFAPDGQSDGKTGVERFF